MLPQGYEVHVYDSVTNQTSFLGNTTETYLRISSLQAGHNYTFSVQARCLVGGQLCGEAALLLYDQLTAGTHIPRPESRYYGRVEQQIKNLTFTIKSIEQNRTEKYRTE